MINELPVQRAKVRSGVVLTIVLLQIMGTILLYMWAWGSSFRQNNNVSSLFPILIFGFHGMLLLLAIKFSLKRQDGLTGFICCLITPILLLFINTFY
jgi:hypothetical protein